MLTTDKQGMSNGLDDSFSQFAEWEFVKVPHLIPCICGGKKSVLDVPITTFLWSQDEAQHKAQKQLADAVSEEKSLPVLQCVYELW